jgi:hypothetical protein
LSAKAADAGGPAKSGRRIALAYRQQRLQCRRRDGIVTFDGHGLYARWGRGCRQSRACRGPITVSNPFQFDISATQYFESVA